MKSKGMILDVLKTNWNGLRLALICNLLMAFAAAPLHAQLTYTDLFDFNCSSSEGCWPLNYGSLVPGLDGNLYGTASEGGPGNLGVVFSVTTTNPAIYTTVCTFNGTNGQLPFSGLTADLSFPGLVHGKFYGTTYSGGSNGGGTLFECNADTGTIVVLHNFGGTDIGGGAQPVWGSDKNLYGGTYSGAVYRVTLPAQTFSYLTQKAQGPVLYPLFQSDCDGNLYGTSDKAGVKGASDTIFRLTTTGGSITTLHTFSGDGAEPVGPLMENPCGTLYGTTAGGGLNGTGEVFQFTLATKTLNPQYSFDALSPSNTNTYGASPLAGLVPWSGGLLGVTSEGGYYGYGTIFSVNSGNPTKFFDFSGTSGFLGATGVPGATPFTTLFKNSDGAFYGLSSGEISVGFSPGPANYFRLTPPDLSQIISWCCNAFHNTGDPLIILGDTLEGVVTVSIGGVPAQFQPGSNTYLTAIVPSNAVDGLVSVVLATGEQVESESTLHILPTITNLDPSSGPPGTEVGIVGGGFAGASKVTFGGVKATGFTVNSPTLIVAIVPAGAKTGKVKVTTPNGTASSKETFTVN